jgi:uncharacterized membrane protein
LSKGPRQYILSNRRNERYVNPYAGHVYILAHQCPAERYQGKGPDRLLPVPEVDYVDDQHHEENPQPAAGTIRRRVFFCLEESMVRGGTIKGALFMSSANVSFCAMACMVKYVAHLNVYTTTLFRFLVGMGIMGLLAMSGRISLSFVNKPALFARGLMGGASIAISFLSIAKLGLIKAGIIIQLYPMFAAIFGWVLLKERLSIGAMLSIIGSFGGVCLLLTDHPGAGFVSPGIGRRVDRGPGQKASIHGFDAGDLFRAVPYRVLDRAHSGKH